MPLWSVVLVGLIGIGIGAVAGGSDGDTDGSERSSAAAVVGDVDAEGRSSRADETSTTTPRSTTTERVTTTTRAATTTTTAPPEQGTRENPFPAGTPLVTSDGVEVTVSSVNLDANGAVAAENQFNDPPPEGSRYVLVNLSIVNRSDEPINPWLEVDVEAIGSGNAVHGDCYAVLPDDLDDAPELYPGGSASGNVCVVVPNVEIDDGSLLLMVAPMFGDPAFMRF